MSEGRVLVFGATSAIARSTAASFAEKGYDLTLCARDGDELDRIASDLRIRFGRDVRYECFDAEDFASHAALVERARGNDDLAGVLLAFGDMPETPTDIDAAFVVRMVNRNLTGAMTLLEACATQLEAQKGGFIVAISSVAGDRGRQSNYLYGTAKGGLSVYLQGLRNRLHASGIRVVTVKPGYVDTRMTFGKIESGLMASPDAVGATIAKLATRGPSTAYVPWFWRPIMLIIRLIPEAIFKRLRL